MSFINLSHSLRALLTAICLALCIFPSTSWGAEDGEETLDLFTAWQGEAATASRAPKPLSQTAENVTVVTRREIESLNAHTLADVLITVPGIQVDMRGGPGSMAFTFIQSSNFNHVLVLVDGVPLNSLTDNFSDTGSVPADIIERIEIVKGAASSAWGQALGGVINVITRSPERERTVTGAASASIGERTTNDSRAELTGTANGVGYLLSGGYLGSNGILPHRQLFSSNGYTKLTHDLPYKGQLFATLRYSRASQGDVFIPQFDFKEDQDTRNLYATLGLTQPLGERLTLELLARHAYRNINIFVTQVSDNAAIQTIKTREKVSGAGLKLVWRGDSNLMVAGADYEHAEMKNTDALTQVDQLNRTVDRWGLFLNDTLTLGPVAVIPGARFDRTMSGGDLFSPSLGATLQLDDKTVLRGFTARGYSLPSLTRDRPTEKVWTSQIGVESSAIPHLWLKGTLFRNETWNVLVVRPENHTERRIALGIELEARTTPVFNTSLGAGWTYTDTYRTNDRTSVLGAPRHTLQLALRYDDQTYRGTLTGRQIYWHSDPSFNGKYYGLVWDLHLGVMLLKKEQSSLELFFSGHNLFNGNQFQDELLPSTGRWFDGGMRVRF